MVDDAIILHHQYLGAASGYPVIAVGDRYKRFQPALIHSGVVVQQHDIFVVKITNSPVVCATETEIHLILYDFNRLKIVVNDLDGVVRRVVVDQINIKLRLSNPQEGPDTIRKDKSPR